MLAERLDVVLSVLYLIFNQGWDDRRADLAGEAIRLARTVTGLLPREGEAGALLALMLLHDSRRSARVAGGVLVPLAEQDHTRWDAAAITEGQAVLDRALAAGARGPYAVQAAIAALYTDDPVDWPGVVALHDRLVRLSDGSPVVALNRAVAVAETEGPAAALRLVDALAPALGDYRYLPSTRADLLRRLGHVEAAREAYARAVALAVTEPERRFLEGRPAHL